MINFLYFLILVLSLNNLTFAMEKKPYHHLSDGTFRNPEGSPKRDPNVKWSYKIFNQEKKKLNMTVPKEHVVEKEKVLLDLKKYQKDDYIAWIGHATFLIKLGETTIITDPVFSKNAGPLIFGPDRFTEPALTLNEIPKIDLFLLTHNHYDHQDMSTIRRFPFKDAKVMLPPDPEAKRPKSESVCELEFLIIPLFKAVAIAPPDIHFSKNLRFARYLKLCS